jgi:hypothetical protein
LNCLVKFVMHTSLLNFHSVFLDTLYNILSSMMRKFRLQKKALDERGRIARLIIWNVLFLYIPLSLRTSAWLRLKGWGEGSRNTQSYKILGKDIGIYTDNIHLSHLLVAIIYQIYNYWKVESWSSWLVQLIIVCQLEARPWW